MKNPIFMTNIKLEAPMRLPLTNFTNNITEGAARFASNRSGGRFHAGIDFYCDEGTPVYAMCDCTILRSSNTFYLGTGVVEVQTPQFVIRYGEITPKKGLVTGDKINKGDIIGTVKRCEGLAQAMLHLEMYTADATLPLTNTAGTSPFKRTHGIVDPTALVLKLIKE